MTSAIPAKTLITITQKGCTLETRGVLFHLTVLFARPRQCFPDRLRIVQVILMLGSTVKLSNIQYYDEKGPLVSSMVACQNSGRSVGSASLKCVYCYSTHIVVSIKNIEKSTEHEEPLKQ